ncbi:hypothetical protein SAMN05421640_1601 [Ekhidna lutea]|uniref:Uncharacterized protein n=1 Tax=Ekhidna lutea TaxID=447679 RepID=A0A239HZH3_EKHLU|nr:hypothetical protein SAMN05421640_1601 [Ekhidna lutea]
MTETGLLLADEKDDRSSFNSYSLHNGYWKQ